MGRTFTERQVLETIIRQMGNSGHETFRCYRCQGLFWLSDEIEREHLHEIALGGANEPANCVYSHKRCHAIITNGTPATTAGSSKHRIAKTRGNRAAKFAVRKLRLDKKRDPKPRYGNTTFRSTPR